MSAADVEFVDKEGYEGFARGNKFCLVEIVTYMLTKTASRKS